MAQVDPAQLQRSLQIVWWTLLASQAVYVAVIVSGVGRVRGEPLDLPALPIVLAAMAAASGLAANFFWRRASGAGRPLHSAPPDAQAAFTNTMVAWVLDESIAVYGLVLGLLAFSAAGWAPFSLAALVLLLLHRPRP